jgi:hypothetical protein
MSAAHSERKHSKYSASGADRWEACPGSVELSEGQPDKSSPWAIEGTEAHEILEQIMIASVAARAHRVLSPKFSGKVDREMITHGTHAANIILGEWGKHPGSDILVETRITLDWIHPEMFGTFDGAVVDPFGTLNVYDFKYGQGHAVSASENMQMAFYAIGLAHKYHWNFKRIRMWIIQPRIKGYDGPTFWEVPTMELKTKWVDRLRKAVERVEAEPNTYIEGGHCHWCKAKKVCPLKIDAKNEKAKTIFTPIGGTNGKEESNEKGNLKTEAQWRKDAREGKGKRKVNEALTEISLAYEPIEDYKGSADFF